MEDRADSSSAPLVAPSPMKEPNEIDLEAGPGEQIQCRICLETDGKNSAVLPFWFNAGNFHVRDRSF